jgi:GH18 family chitinase
LENNLDGVDFDWEFPDDDSQLKNYIALLTETKAAFEPLGMTVSVALSPDNKDLLGEFAVADRIHIMSYDRGPQHSTYEQAVTDLQTFLDAGLPRKKLILGVPFYGRKETPPYSAMPYAEILQLYHPNSSIDEAGDIFFNGIETIQRKVCLSIREGIAGVMIWELSQDTVDETSLLLAIQKIKTEGCAP